MRTVHGLDGVRSVAGVELAPSEWLEITQDRVNAFADATGDHQWIHVDVERARQGPFGGTIAHGYLTLALLIPLWTQVLRIEGVGMAVNYGLNKVRFPAPLPVGSKIRLRATVLAVRDVLGGAADAVEATVAMTLDRDGGDKPVAVAEAVYRFYA
jgi:acyl dehydratase